MILTIKGRIPSKKNSRQIVKNGGRTFLVTSDQYQNALKSIVPQVNAQKGINRLLKPFDMPLILRYVFSIEGKRRHDLDNLITSVNDILQECGVIADDCLIRKIEAEKRLNAPEYIAQIEILKMEE